MPTGDTPYSLRGTYGFPPGIPGASGHAPGLERYIRSQTMDGKDIADYLLGVMRDKEAPQAVRVQVADILAKRGFSPPVARTENTNTDSGPILAELRTWTLAEIRAFKAHLDSGAEPPLILPSRPGVPPGRDVSETHAAGQGTGLEVPRGGSVPLSPAQSRSGGIRRDQAGSGGRGGGNPRARAYREARLKDGG